MSLTDPLLTDYITLYTKIFAFDEPPKEVPTPEPVPEPEQATEPARINLEDYNYIDPSRIKVPSIYVNVSDNKKVNGSDNKKIITSGLNIGDGYSYLDFNTHIPSGVISFYRRGKSTNKLLPMQYKPDTNTLYAIVNGKSKPFKVINTVLKNVLDQIVKMRPVK